MKYIWTVEDGAYSDHTVYGFFDNESEAIDYCKHLGHGFVIKNLLGRPERPGEAPSTLVYSHDDFP